MTRNRIATKVIGILTLFNILLVLHAHWHHAANYVIVLGLVCSLIGLSAYTKALVITKVIRIEPYKEDWSNIVTLQITPDICYSYLKWGTKKDWRYGFLQCTWFNRGVIVYFLNPDEE